MDSILSVFEFEANQGRYFIDEQGDLWFALIDVLRMADSKTVAANAQKTVEANLGKGLLNEKPLPDATGFIQNTVIVHEAAFTFLVSRFRTELGKKLNRYIHVELLPTIRKTGGYISPSASKEQLEALQQQIERQKLQLVEQQRRIELLTTHAKILENQSDRISFIADFLANNCVFTPNKYILSNLLYDRFLAWTGKETADLFTKTEVFRTIDTYLKTIQLPKSKRFYIDKDGGYGDLENASLVPMKKAMDNAYSFVCGLGE